MTNQSRALLTESAPNNAVEPTAPVGAFWHADAIHGAAAHRQR